MAVVAALAVLAAAALVSAAPAAALQDPSASGRERLIGEFSSAVSRPGTPEDLCLTLHLNDEVIHESGTEPLAPASLMKVATAAVALEVMGPDATYTTEVAVRADALEQVSDGVLNGDLYLIGGGDPTLSTPGYIATMSRTRPFTDVNDLADTVMASLESHGIRVVNGAVVGDESRYPEAERHYTSQMLSGVRIWKRTHASLNSAGPLSALMINDGYHPYRGSRRSHVRPSDPAAAAASLFDDLLEARGLVIRRTPKSAEAPEQVQRNSLGRLASVPMAQVVTRMLTHSDNTTSEMVLKEIGHRAGDGSLRWQAAETASEVLRRMLGKDADGVLWVDGSGLSTHNRMTCRAVARLLSAAGPGSPLVDALAVAGQTGTLRNCGPTAPTGTTTPQNQVLAKTGTLNDTNALAGIAAAPNGDIVTFAMIASEHLIILAGGCTLLRRGLIDAAANYTYGPPRPAAANPPDDAPRPAASLFGVLIDIPDDLPVGVHAPAVRELAGAGVALACDETGRRFCPRLPIPRAELAWYIAERLDLPAAPTLDRFSDVAPTSPHAASIAALAHAGITAGCDVDGGRFCPNRSVTRAEVATFLTRALDLPAAPTLDRFSDVAPSSSHAASIAALAHAGITAGCDVDGGRYCPGRTLTRAEFATLLHRALAR